MTTKHALLRQLPSVNTLLLEPDGVALARTFGHTLAREGLRTALADVRTALLSDTAASENGHTATVPPPADFITAARSWLEELCAPTLFPVINATGVVIHTNLGRAPLSADARQAIAAIAGSYSALEYAIESGKRGSRSVHAEWLLHRVTGAETALVVNNAASAVLLLLSALCAGREVIISRGQLVEIGGGFRIPDVLAQSGAQLVEVGTTNRTHLRDYANAITQDTAAILVVHQSNYRVVGFTTEPSLQELAELAHAHELPLLYDQGSGALLDVTPYGLEPEPTVSEGLEAGCDIIAFSGDKLLGGPQAGILCGRRPLLEQIKRHPLARAVRADKLCLAGLSATLDHYLKEEALEKVPIWRMLARPLAQLEMQAQAWADTLATAGLPAEVSDGYSAVGGGSLPGSRLPTKLLAIPHVNAEALAAALRRHHIPIIGRIQDDQFLLDPRTVLEEQNAALLAALKQCLSSIQ